MLFYHGTTQNFKTFSLSYAEDYKDFGKGIYLSYEEWHARAIARKKPNAPHKWIITCDLDISELRRKFKVKEFKKVSEQWVKFVLEKRNTLSAPEFDVVIGYTADASAQDLLEGFWRAHYDRNKGALTASKKDYRQLISNLNVHKYPRQLCFTSPKAVHYLNGKIQKRIGSVTTYG